MTAPTTFLPFSDAADAGMHCERLIRSMAKRTILDWLDVTLAGVATD